VPRGLTEEDRGWIREAAEYSLEFARFAVALFKDVVLSNRDYVDLIMNDAYALKTHYMALVDGENRSAFYDGTVRVIDQDGKEYVKFHPRDYDRIIGEWV